MTAVDNALSYFRCHFCRLPVELNQPCENPDCERRFLEEVHAPFTGPADDARCEDLDHEGAGR